MQMTKKANANDKENEKATDEYFETRMCEWQQKMFEAMKPINETLLKINKTKESVCEKLEDDNKDECNDDNIEDVKVWAQQQKQSYVRK